MKFSTPEYWSVQPFPSPGDLSNPGIECRSPVLQVDSLTAEPQGKPRKKRATKNVHGSALYILCREGFSGAGEGVILAGT